MATQIATTETKTTSGTIARWMDNTDISRQIVGALAGYMDGATFKAQCALAARDPNLAKCDPTSLFAAFLLCAQMGLLPGKQHAHVALIPRAGQVDVMPQWQGLLYLMRRQATVKDVRVMLVHVTDTFAFDAENNTVIHTFKDGDPFAEREFVYPTTANPTGNLRGGYLRVEFHDGRILYHMVPLHKIKRNMACAQKDNIWRQWFPEMALKTVVRDAWARRVVPIDPEMAEPIGKALGADDAVLGNDPSRIVDAEPALPVLVHDATATEPAPATVAPPATTEPKDDGSAGFFAPNDGELKL